jgi:hypothetical protein
MVQPPFLEHAVKGAVVGGLLGGSIAAVGWAVRQRNTGEVDLGAAKGVLAPTLLARYRGFSEELLMFKEIASRIPALWPTYAGLVADCEYAAQHSGAAGGQQIEVQKRATRAAAAAHRFATSAFKYRDPLAQDCKMQAGVVETHLNGLIKNMMMSSP